jgi:hypothetical protein
MLAGDDKAGVLPLKMEFPAEVTRAACDEARSRTQRKKKR